MVYLDNFILFLDWLGLTNLSKIYVSIKIKINLFLNTIIIQLYFILKILAMHTKITANVFE